MTANDHRDPLDVAARAREQALDRFIATSNELERLERARDHCVFVGLALFIATTIAIAGIVAFVGASRP